jgi:hypothetical protein
MAGERRLLFGDVARLRGDLSAEQVLAALNIQRAEQEDGQHRRIGEILVDIGLITRLQRMEILEAQRMGALPTARGRS